MQFDEERKQNRNAWNETRIIFQLVRSVFGSHGPNNDRFTIHITFMVQFRWIKELLDYDVVVVLDDYE